MIPSELLILLQLNLVQWHIIISWIVEWKDWIALSWSRSRSQEMFRIPGNVHLDDICWTFCDQTWYGDASSWARVSCKKAHLLSSRTRSQWGLIWLDVSVSTIPTDSLIFLHSNLILMVHHHKLECLMYVNVWLFSRSTSQWRFRTSLNFYVSHIFYTTGFLATKLGVMMYYS